jgi:hypothetical protein
MVMMHLSLVPVGSDSCRRVFGINTRMASPRNEINLLLWSVPPGEWPVAEICLELRRILRGLLIAKLAPASGRHKLMDIARKAPGKADVRVFSVWSSVQCARSLLLAMW